MYVQHVVPVRSSLEWSLTIPNFSWRTKLLTLMVALALAASMLVPDVARNITESQSVTATDASLRDAVLGSTTATRAGDQTIVETSRAASVRATAVLETRPVGDAVTFNVADFVPAAATVVVNADGSATVSDAAGVVVSTIEAPWAVDAVGAPVATAYTANGLLLTQSLALDSGEFVYPIIADPKFTTGWTGLFVQWYRSEAKWLNGLTWTALAGAVAVLCAGPHVLLCGAAVASIYYVVTTFTDWAIDQLYNRGCRLETRLLPWISTYVKC